MPSIPERLPIQHLNATTFDRLRNLIQSETGIYLGDSKTILLSNRLRKRLQALGLGSYEDYYDLLTARAGIDEMTHFVDAVSTNETYFYRGDTQFEALQRTILPEMFRTRTRLRIWSAAASTGEEAYSILIAAEEAAKSSRWVGKMEVVGTDINGTVLEAAQRGLYSGKSLRKLPQAYRDTYFRCFENDRFEIADELKEKVRFQRHNLLKDEPLSPEFDIIFCRNVLMYFTRTTQQTVINRQLAGALVPDGYLLIGSSESLVGLDVPFQYVQMNRCPIYALKAKGRNSA